MPALSPDDDRAILNQLRDTGFTRKQAIIVLSIVKQVTAASAPSAPSTPAATPGQTLVNALVFGRR